jgi:hypothetical protein
MSLGWRLEGGHMLSGIGFLLVLVRWQRQFNPL